MNGSECNRETQGLVLIIQAPRQTPDPPYVNLQP